VILASGAWTIESDRELDPRTDFAAVYETHYQSVYRAVRGIALDADLAEDVTQDAFLKAYRARGRYRPDGRLEAWLSTIAVREALSRVRWLALQRRLVRLVSLREGEPTPPSSLPDLVDEALSVLSPSTRAVVVLHHEHGYRYREIAELLGVPEGTVASRLSDGLRRMRRHLENSRDEALQSSPGRHRWTRKR
jgi:RNA polymerase sigma-70 factor (ECF subfamily)